MYHHLLRLFPRAFRERFGADMTDVFRDRLADARTHGRAAVLALWVRTVIDVTRHAVAERRAARRLRTPRGGFMSGLFDDFASAIRGLRRRPGFALTAALMLAIGLGFNTTLFAVVHAVILKPLPYADAGRIAMLWTGRNPDGTGGVNSYADFLDWKERNTCFDGLATYNISFAALAEGDEPEEVAGSVVSPEFFRVLGARLQLGRSIEAGDELIPVTETRPIVIADSLWERRFNRDPTILNRIITLADRPRRIVGVLSADFKQPEPFWGRVAEYWSPLVINDAMRTQRAFHYLRVIGRLKPAVTFDRAQAEMDAIGHQLMTSYPITNTNSVVVSPVRDELMGDTRPLLWLFLGAVSLVLLLAVANIVNLLLAKASGRRAELALRAALGASRGRLISQLVCESTVLGLLGGTLGLVLAQAGIRLLVRYGPVSAPGIEETSIDLTVLVFTVGLSALTGALCGAVPALRVARARLLSASGGEMRGSSGLEVSRTRRWLVAAEMALAVPLLVGAALLSETLVSMQRVNLGFDPTHTLQFRLTMTGARYDKSESLVAFFATLRPRLSAIPGVTSVGMVSSLPLGGLNNTGGGIVYTDESGRQADLGVGFRSIAGSYFATLGVPLAQGKLFADDATDTNTVIINDVAARQMWGTASAIGRRVRFGNVADAANTNPWLTVVGVVGSLRHERITVEASPEIFQPYRANTANTMTMTLRTDGDPAALSAPVRAVVHELEPRVPVVALAPVSDFVDGQLARPRFGVLCSSLFGVLGLALAAFGTFAVLSLLVAQRTKEIGIRMALGATPGRVGALMLWQSLVPALAGCTLGGLVAAWLARGLSSQLFGVAPRDPIAFAAAVGVLAVVACAASWWPAQRAMRVNPVSALRMS